METITYHTLHTCQHAHNCIMVCIPVSTPCILPTGEGATYIRTHASQYGYIQDHQNMLLDMLHGHVTHLATPFNHTPCKHYYTKHIDRLLANLIGM